MYTFSYNDGLKLVFILIMSHTISHTIDKTEDKTVFTNKDVKLEKFKNEKGNQLKNYCNF